MENDELIEKMRAQSGIEQSEAVESGYNEFHPQVIRKTLQVTTGYSKRQVAGCIILALFVVWLIRDWLFSPFTILDQLEFWLSGSISLLAVAWIAFYAALCVSVILAVILLVRQKR